MTNTIIGETTRFSRAEHRFLRHHFYINFTVEVVLYQIARETPGLGLNLSSIVAVMGINDGSEGNIIYLGYVWRPNHYIEQSPISDVKKRKDTALG